MSRSRVWEKVANKASNTVTVTASCSRISSVSDVYRHRLRLRPASGKTTSGYNETQTGIKNGGRERLCARREMITHKKCSKW